MSQSADESAQRTRWEAAMALLNKSDWVKKLRSSCLFEIYPFHSDLDSPIGLEQLDTLKPEGKSTHLNLSLNRLFERLRGQELAGVLVLTDAIDTREKRDTWAEMSWPTPLYVAELEKPGLPDDKPDMRVDMIDTPRRAIVGWDTAMSVTVAGQGGKGEPFQVQLLKSGKEIDKVAVQLPPEGGSRDVQFKLAHPEVGSETYTVRIPVLPGEVQTNDNELVVVDVWTPRTAYCSSKTCRVLKASTLPARCSPTRISRRWRSSRCCRADPNSKWIAYGDRQGLVFDLTPEQLSLNKLSYWVISTPKHFRPVLPRDPRLCRKGRQPDPARRTEAVGFRRYRKNRTRQVAALHACRRTSGEGRFNVVWTAEGRAIRLANNPTCRPPYRPCSPSSPAPPSLAVRSRWPRPRPIAAITRFWSHASTAKARCWPC